MARKRRPEAWWNKLASEADAEAVFQHGETHSLESTVAWLKAEFGIETSRDPLSRWLEEQRKARDMHERFGLRVLAIEQANQSANQLSEYVGNALGLHNANITLLSQALLDAQLAGDPKSRKELSEQLASLVDALAKNKRADAAVQDSKTARDKFEWDAAEAALERAAELQAINAEQIDDTEKRQRAIKVLFGERPSHVKTAKEVLA